MTLLEQVAEKDFPGMAGQRAGFVINSGHVTTAFSFRRGNPLPLGILRLGSADVRKEHDILEFLGKSSDRTLAESVPAPLGIHTFGNREIASYSYIETAPMSPGLSCMQSHFSIVRDWLARLAGLPAPEFLAKASEDRDMGSRCDILLKRFEKSEPMTTRRIVGSALKAEETLQNAGIRKVIAHNDLCWHNIAFSRGNIFIFDWESAKLRWPMIDWFTFICSYAARTAGHDTPDPHGMLTVMREIFFHRTTATSIILSETHKLMNSLSLPPETCYPFYAVAMLDYIQGALRFRNERLEQTAFLFAEKDNIFAETAWTDASS
ncbi:MAG: phosphotransferase [bacterium]